MQQRRVKLLSATVGFSAAPSLQSGFTANLAGDLGRIVDLVAAEPAMADRPINRRIHRERTEGTAGGQDMHQRWVELFSALADSVAEQHLAPSRCDIETRAACRVGTEDVARRAAPRTEQEAPVAAVRA